MANPALNIYLALPGRNPRAELKGARPHAHTIMPAPSWFMSFKESCDLTANLLRLRLDGG